MYLLYATIYSITILYLNQDLVELLQRSDRLLLGILIGFLSMIMGLLTDMIINSFKN